MTDDIIDYAMPLMNIERMAKEIHDLCLEYKYEKAVEVALHMAAESRVLKHTLTIMNDKEKKHGVPKDVTPGQAQLLHQQAPLRPQEGHDGRGQLRAAAH